MKNNIIILASIIFAATIMFVGCEDDFDSPPIEIFNPDMVLTIADIYQIQADSCDNSDSYVFTEDYMLFATVTLNDDEGNIYKEAYVQDSTGGINLYKLSHSGAFNVGDYIRINLNGAEVIEFKGKMEIKFDSILDFGKQMVVQETNVPIEPDSVSIADILTGEYSCKLVKVYDVQFEDDELLNTYCVEAINDDYIESEYDMNRDIQNCDGQSLIVRTSNYASFAKDTVPQGRGYVIGIATKFDPEWQLLVRSTDEVKMDAPRCE